MSLREQMRRDGVVVLRNVFSADEITQLRAVCTRHLRLNGRERKGGRHEPSPKKALPEIDWVYEHPAIVSAMQEILGEPEVEMAECDLHMSQFLGWHKDIGSVPAGSFREDHFESDEFAIYKVGVYLQDHTEQRGLTVRVGSHRAREIDAGELRYMPTHAGDVTVIDVRLSHNGTEPDPVERLALRLGKLFGWGGRPSRVGRMIREAYWRLKGRGERIGIFMTFGAANHFTDSFKLLWEARSDHDDY
jgi:hypothetical protein